MVIDRVSQLLGQKRAQHAYCRPMAAYDENAFRVMKARCHKAENMRQPLFRVAL